MPMKKLGEISPNHAKCSKIIIWDLILSHGINLLENLLCPGWMPIILGASIEWVFDSSYLDMRWSALWSWSLSLDESLLASFRSCCTVRDILGTLWCSRLKLQRPVSAVLCGSYFLSLSYTWFSASPTGTTQQQPGRARVTQIVRLVFACAAIGLFTA